MDVRLTRAAFLEGSRRSAGEVVNGYQGPLADWMEALTEKSGARRAPRKRAGTQPE